MKTREGSAQPELTALLGEGASFEGKLIFEGRVRIDGTFRGSIASDDTLVVGDGAVIEADVSVGTLIVLGGTIRGDIRAKHGVELHAPSKIHGDITTPQLAIDRGVVFEGKSHVADPTGQELPANAEPATADESATGHSQKE